MCLLFGCDYERQSRDLVPVFSVFVCVTPTLVSLHLFAVFLISISQHGRFVSLIVSASVLLSRVAADLLLPGLSLSV